MAEPRPKLAVPLGLNVWRLIRTDRDGAKQEDIPRTAAAATLYFLRELVSPEPPAHLVPTGPSEWRYGEARPIRVTAVSRKAGPPMPANGVLLADRMRVPETVPTVVAKRPWWVRVDFWWRGPSDSQVIDYPGVRQGLFWPSWELNGADWILDQAVYVPDAEDPGDETWTEAMGDKAQAAFLRATGDLGDLLADIGRGAGIALALLALAWASRRKR